MAFGRGKAKLSEVSVSLPFQIGKVKWIPDQREVEAAWSLYVELVTRVAVQELPRDEGLVREALTSLHALFAETRSILRTAGPGVGAKMPSIGGLAIGVLNKGLRPFLTKWHPELLHWEACREPDASPRQHERAFPRMDELREELATLQSELKRYAVALSRVAGVDGDDE